VERHNSSDFSRREFSALALPLALWAYAALSTPSTSQPPPRVPSNVAWTEEIVTEASAGNAFRGLLLAKHCEHCHGSEGFSANRDIPNLAAMDRLSFWKQMDDFSSRKRNSAVMRSISAPLKRPDFADLGRLLLRVARFS